MHKIKLLFFLLTSLFLFNYSLQAQRSIDWEMTKNLDIYTSLLQQLNQHYVEDIQAGKMTKTAINAMLKDLDPYTVYYPEADIEDVRFLQTGKYGGIGSYVHIKNDTLIVGMPSVGFPFYKAGLRAGDIILKIDDKDATHKTMDEISDMLRGPAGTELTINYLDPKNRKPHSVKLRREEIKVKNVPFYTKINDSVAYVKLSGFTETAAQEVMNAIQTMNSNHQLKSLVFDLRFNGGGLLGQAVAIMDMFVPANEMIVSVRGKTTSENANYRTHQPALFPEMKVVVLVNNRSASASEIVAGSFQDLDRAVIMGQKSFGKGLVQKVYKLSYKSQVKITVAKYYIPSGRCIQALDYQHKDAEGHAATTADSLQAVFKTKNGRLVKDAGGILPDVKLKKNIMSDYTANLAAKYMIFDFATYYVNNYDSIVNLEQFEISDALYDDFVNFVQQHEFTYKTATEKIIAKLEKQAKEEGFDEEFKTHIELMKKELHDLKSKEVFKYKEEISRLLRIEIASRYFFLEGKVSASLRDDSEVKAAVELLNDSKRYYDLLSGGNQ
ncbi:MAG: peptidase S41 [Bacteroidetes bacterium]|nr:MAG: peptidase S41 [Bacteroidota bacterium]